VNVHHEIGDVPVRVSHRVERRSRTARNKGLGRCVVGTGKKDHLRCGTRGTNRSHCGLNGSSPRRDVLRTPVEFCEKSLVGVDSREYHGARSCCDLSVNMNGRGLDNLHSKNDSALVLPVVGNVGPELSKDLVAGATLANDLGTGIFQTKGHITRTGPTSPLYRA
jgi:hypothetical protein